MIRTTLFGLAAALTVAAAPAGAVTFIMGGATQNVASVAVSADGSSLTATAGQFTAAPGTLTSLSQITQNLLVSRTAPGVGVYGGASNPQIDTNQPNRREALLVTLDKAMSLGSLKLSYIDSNDTLAVYGVKADGSLVNLGFGGLIHTGLAGAASVVNTAANDGTSALTLNTPTASYSRYLFTTRVGGEVNYGGLGQGYRIDSLTLNAVPEPATWAMLIAGFGLVGMASRRRRATSVHA